MTVLAALTAHYERLSSDGAVPPYGYSSEGISYVIALHPNGQFDEADVRRTPDAGSAGRARSLLPQPKPMNVPRNPEPRTGTKRVPQFLWDNAKYVFGVAMREGAYVDAEDEHAAFCGFQRSLLADTREPGLLALLRFLEDWRASDHSRLRYSEDLLDHNRNVVFRLDGERSLLHELPEAKERWACYLERAVGDSSGQQGQCLGRVDTSARQRRPAPSR